MAMISISYARILEYNLDNVKIDCQVKFIEVKLLKRIYRLSHK
jgi:hypothetical protein